MDSYLYELQTIPEAHRDLFDLLNRKIVVAFDKAARGDKSLTKTPTGYYVVTNGELVEITHQNNDEGGAWYWIAHEANDHWYTDPETRLTDLKHRLGL